jgi:hypothetical protein
MRAAQLGAQWVWAGVLTGGYAGQAAEGMVPSKFVEGAHITWQVAVGEPHQSSIPVRL